MPKSWLFPPIFKEWQGTTVPLPRDTHKVALEQFDENYMTPYYNRFQCLENIVTGAYLYECAPLTLSFSLLCVAGKASSIRYFLMALFLIGGSLALYYGFIFQNYWICRWTANICILSKIGQFVFGENKSRIKYSDLRKNSEMQRLFGKESEDETIDSKSSDFDLERNNLPPSR